MSYFNSFLDNFCLNSLLLFFSTFVVIVVFIYFLTNSFVYCSFFSLRSLLLCIRFAFFLFWFYAMHFLFTHRFCKNDLFFFNFDWDIFRSDCLLLDCLLDIQIVYIHCCPKNLYCYFVFVCISLALMSCLLLISFFFHSLLFLVSLLLLFSILCVYFFFLLFLHT